MFLLPNFYLVNFSKECSGVVFLTTALSASRADLFVIHVEMANEMTVLVPGELIDQPARRPACMKIAAIIHTNHTVMV